MVTRLMMHVCRVLLAAAALFGFRSNLVRSKEWWENANYYQIYPRSFKDSDGDGIGDLNGVTQKLQYLKDIGFTAAWLSPIFKSPMVDFGYDISDFYAIHPEYGTMEDFKALVARAKQVGIRIILDFVPNHTSDECEWFVKSVNREPGYEDFYVWSNGTVDANGKRQPPSNWISAFRYSAWQWNDKRQQYYLHQFSIKQADLNFRNPLVVAKMKEVMRYWLDTGISGFRIDAIPFMFEKEPYANGSYPDEPVIDNVSVCPDPDDECHLKHIYTQDQPESIEMVYQWRELVEQYRKEKGGESIVLLTEAYTSLDNLMLYYGDGQRNGSMVPFNFYLMRNLKNDSTAPQAVDYILQWMTRMPLGVQANWVLGNHDNPRYSTRLGVQRADLFTIMLQTLPGNAVTYNGEELAMTDGKVTWEQTVDPQGCNANPSNYESYSRDPCRTPYQWDATKNAGFSSGARTWLPVASNYRTNNALAQLRAPKSHLQLFMKLIRLRQMRSLQDGALKIKAIGNDIIIYSREASGDDMFVIVLNLGGNKQSLNINEYFDMGSKAEVITSSMQSGYHDGIIIDPSKYVAEPYVGVVLVKL
ncbi:maltase A1-like [Bactrocera tryoni]|uniref:maltase A1-like n=1 Tax=Bactrocera tryoni TaxID=59916 RepID=UPI001A965BAF|nr:maltase A1-like [Bactrocera tryoni]